MPIHQFKRALDARGAQSILKENIEQKSTDIHLVQLISKTILDQNDFKSPPELYYIEEMLQMIKFHKHL
jgi:hypothetical protein